MKKGRVRGFFVVIILVLALTFSFSLGSPRIEAGNDSRDNTQGEDTAWINAEIEDLEKNPEMQIAGWTITTITTTGLKEVDIWVYELTPENQQLDGTMIGEWKVTVWEKQKPPEGGEATDEEAAWIKSEIGKLKEKPELQIGGTSIHRTEKTVVLWVYEGTPENQQLHGTMIDGWKIVVAKPIEPELPKTIILVVVAILLSISLLIVSVIALKRRKEGRK